MRNAHDIIADIRDNIGQARTSEFASLVVELVEAYSDLHSKYNDALSEMADYLKSNPI